MLVLDALGSRTDEVPLTPAAPTTAIGRVHVDDLPSTDATTLIDVRRPDETAAGVIPGAVTVPLDDLLADAAAVPVAGITVVYCGQGPRARAAVHALAAHHPGADLRILLGGYAAWSERNISR
ncbi:rhodanese-like domain-containing protein [Gordonia humi]